MRTVLFSLVLFLLTTFNNANAIAGWYKVTNYVGTIGKYPIHISIQSYSFGSGITVEGSYYYDKQRSPIPLYGKYNKDGKLELCEILDEKTFERKLIKGSEIDEKTEGCPFVMSIHANGATGLWSKGSSNYEIMLNKIAVLDDTEEIIIDGIVKIPFWGQTKNHMFIGVYVHSDLGMICLEKIEIINKKNGNIDQEISFEKDECDAGLLSTPIYMNVEKYKLKGKERIVVNYRGGRMGYIENYIFNESRKKYVHIRE